MRFPFARHCEALSGAAAIRSFSGDRKGRNYNENVGPAIPWGASKEGSADPSLAVSIRVGQGRGRIRNLPLPCVPSFATFLRTSEEKLTTQLTACEQAAELRLTPPASLRSATSPCRGGLERRIAASLRAE